VNRAKSNWWPTFVTALKLGLLSFGGPTAHIGYFREEYVRKKKWLDDREFADLVALCQLLPGPASSQVGIGIGWMRGGWAGSLAAWVGFTLPSALLMAAFAFAYGSLPAAADAGWLKGLELAAVAIVASAVLGMGKTLAPDKPRATIVVASAAAVLLLPYAWAQVAVIAAAAAVGWALRGGESGGANGHAATSQAAHAHAASVQAASPQAAHAQAASSQSAYAHAAAAERADRRRAVALLLLFGLLLLTLPLLRGTFGGPLLALFESFYRSGALVFGGGHVVMPLLEREVVPAGWAAPEQFIAGYAAAQAVPGPLFTFASFLGAASHGWVGAVVATVAVFLPGYLLVVGALPFWQALRRLRPVARAIYGVNAAVVGLLLAALFDPLVVGAVRGAADFSIAAGLYVLLTFWKTPPWALVLLAAAAGSLVYGA